MDEGPEGGIEPTFTRVGGDIVVRIDDVQVQTYVVNFPGDNDMMIDEGAVANLEVEAVPDRTINLPFNVTLSSVEEAADYSLDEDLAAISQDYTLVVDETARVAGTGGTGMSDGTEPFVIHSRMNDGDRVDDIVTATVRTTDQVGNQLTLQTFALDVLDQHMLPAITITGMWIPNPANPRVLIRC